MAGIPGLRIAFTYAEEHEIDLLALRAVVQDVNLRVRLSPGLGGTHVGWLRAGAVVWIAPFVVPLDGYVWRVLLSGEWPWHWAAERGESAPGRTFLVLS